MFHLAAFKLTTLDSTADTDIPALSDQILTIQNNHFLPQQPLKVLAAYASGATLTRAQLNSPKIRQINPTYIRPINVALLPANNPNMQIYPPNSLVVNGQEELQMLAANTNAGAEVTYGGIWLADQIVPPPVGDIFVCRFTVAVAPTAQIWSTLAYTMGTILPAGRYAMIHSEYISATGIFHRWIFDNTIFRPGYLSEAAAGSRQPYELYKGEFGVMGEFFTYALPRLEVLCNAADASGSGYFTVVRVGGPGPETLYGTA